MGAITHNHDLETTAADIAEAVTHLHPELDLRCLICEYKSLIEGVKAFAEEVAKSSDLDEVRQFVATVDEFRRGFYYAETPATQRLFNLERWERNNTLWMAEGHYQ